MRSAMAAPLLMPISCIRALPEAIAKSMGDVQHPSRRRHRSVRSEWPPPIFAEARLCAIYDSGSPSPDAHEWREGTLLKHRAMLEQSDKNDGISAPIHLAPRRMRSCSEILIEPRFGSVVRAYMRELSSMCGVPFSPTARSSSDDGTPSLRATLPLNSATDGRTSRAIRLLLLGRPLRALVRTARSPPSAELCGHFTWRQMPRERTCFAASENAAPPSQNLRQSGPRSSMCQTSIV
ncbi:hypothetical protein ACVI1L_004510 [Bradyrhizobium sp. USDA 4516]